MDDDDADYMQGSDDEVGQNAEDRRYCPNIYPRTMALTILTTTTTHASRNRKAMARVATVMMDLAVAVFL